MFNSDDVLGAVDVVGLEKELAQANISVPELESMQFQLIKSSEVYANWIYI